ncbi:MAG: ABC transporter ATP-binding protein, partial [Acidobacteria bacterium]|nr:ABC transporter ATP-binding protein [Acidobacteriota bacterium]
MTDQPTEQVPHSAASSAAEPFIEFRDVEKSFGEKHVLRGVDLIVRQGEVLVIMGGSGSGKSVTLRHMLGLERPDSGEVFVEGEEISSLAEEQQYPVRRKFGMLFQSGALFDSMNVYENVAFPLREHTDMSEKEVGDNVARVLDLVDLAGTEQSMPIDLSGGMRKRVSLARSIVLNPKIILYDEPTTGLDPITADTINRLIVDLQRKLNVTSVVVTHDIQSTFAVG